MEELVEQSELFAIAEYDDRPLCQGELSVVSTARKRPKKSFLVRRKEMIDFRIRESSHVRSIFTPKDYRK